MVELFSNQPCTVSLGATSEELTGGFVVKSNEGFEVTVPRDFNTTEYTSIPDELGIEDPIEGFYSRATCRLVDGRRIALFDFERTLVELGDFAGPPLRSIYRSNLVVALNEGQTSDTAYRFFCLSCSMGTPIFNSTFFSAAEKLTGGDGVPLRYQVKIPAYFEESHVFVSKYGAGRLLLRIESIPCFNGNTLSFTLTPKLLFSFDQPVPLLAFNAVARELKVLLDFLFGGQFSLHKIHCREDDDQDWQEVFSDVVIESRAPHTVGPAAIHPKLQCQPLGASIVGLLARGLCQPDLTFDAMRQVAYQLTRNQLSDLNNCIVALEGVDSAETKKGKANTLTRLENRAAPLPENLQKQILGLASKEELSRLAQTRNWYAHGKTIPLKNGYSSHEIHVGVRKAILLLQAVLLNQLVTRDTAISILLGFEETRSVVALWELR
jgi:hypothetical protein